VFPITVSAVILHLTFAFVVCSDEEISYTIYLKFTNMTRYKPLMRIWLNLQLRYTWGQGRTDKILR